MKVEQYPPDREDASTTKTVLGIEVSDSSIKPESIARAIALLASNRPNLLARASKYTLDGRTEGWVMFNRDIYCVPCFARSDGFVTASETQECGFIAPSKRFSQHYDVYFYIGKMTNTPLNCGAPRERLKGMLRNGTLDRVIGLVEEGKPDKFILDSLKNYM